ncbi:hypothetical protein QW180_23785 [Vibrio sinaloensis]|nr:hypothetical protein [Vibrio sinaloensis]
MLGKFRTPSLRYTKYTAPFMHNGAIASLSDVVDFYDRGGVSADGRTTDFPQTKSPLIKPLGLSEQEKNRTYSRSLMLSPEKKITMEYPKIPEYQPLFSEEELAEVKKMIFGKDKSSKKRKRSRTPQMHDVAPRILDVQRCHGWCGEHHANYAVSGHSAS